MKRFISVSALVLLAIAATAGKINGPQEFNDNVFIKDSSLYLGGTVVSSTAAELNALDGISSSVTELNYLDYSRRVLLSKDGTTQYAFEMGSGTGTQVIAFTTPFAANPVVIISPTNLAATESMSNIFAVAGAAGVNAMRTNFTTVLLGTTGFRWLAVGQKE